MQGGRVSHYWPSSEPYAPSYGDNWHPASPAIIRNDTNCYVQQQHPQQQIKSFAIMRPRYAGRPDGHHCENICPYQWTPLDSPLASSRYPQQPQGLRLKSVAYPIVQQSWRHAHTSDQPPNNYQHQVAAPEHVPDLQRPSEFPPLTPNSKIQAAAMPLSHAVTPGDPFVPSFIAALMKQTQAAQPLKAPQSQVKQQNRTEGHAKPLVQPFKTSNTPVAALNIAQNLVAPKLMPEIPQQEQQATNFGQIAAFRPELLAPAPSQQQPAVINQARIVTDVRAPARYQTQRGKANRKDMTSVLRTTRKQGGGHPKTQRMTKHRAPTSKPYSAVSIIAPPPAALPDVKFLVPPRPLRPPPPPKVENLNNQRTEPVLSTESFVQAVQQSAASLEAQVASLATKSTSSQQPGAFHRAHQGTSGMISQLATLSEQLHRLTMCVGTLQQEIAASAAPVVSDARGKRYLVTDTCALMQPGRDIDNLINSLLAQREIAAVTLLVPLEVIRELDSLKINGPNQRISAARKAISLLRNVQGAVDGPKGVYRGQRENEVLSHPPRKGDNGILDCMLLMKDNGALVELVTADKNFGLRAANEGFKSLTVQEAKMRVDDLQPWNVNMEERKSSTSSSYSAKEEIGNRNFGSFSRSYGSGQKQGMSTAANVPATVQVVAAANSKNTRRKSKRGGGQKAKRELQRRLQGTK